MLLYDVDQVYLRLLGEPRAFLHRSRLGICSALGAIGVNLTAWAEGM